MKKAKTKFIVTLETEDLINDDTNTFTKEIAIEKLEEFLKENIYNANTIIKIECPLYEITEVKL